MAGKTSETIRATGGTRRVEEFNGPNREEDARGGSARWNIAGIGLCTQSHRYTTTVTRNSERNTGRGEVIIDLS